MQLLGQGAFLEDDDQRAVAGQNRQDVHGHGFEREDHRAEGAQQDQVNRQDNNERRARELLVQAVGIVDDACSAAADQDAHPVGRWCGANGAHQVLRPSVGLAVATGHLGQQRVLTHGRLGGQEAVGVDDPIWVGVHQLILVRGDARVEADHARNADDTRVRLDTANEVS